MRTAATVMTLVAGLWAAGCSGGASPLAPTVAATSTLPSQPAPKAHITVTFGLDAVSGPSLDPSYAEYLRFSSLVIESAGVGANLDWVRGEFYRQNALVERYEMGADELASAGGNRLDASSSRSLMVTFRRNGPCDLVRATFHFTDDRGNEHFIVGNVGPGATPLPASTGGSRNPAL